MTNYLERAKLWLDKYAVVPKREYDVLAFAKHLDSQGIGCSHYGGLCDHDEREKQECCNKCFPIGTERVVGDECPPCPCHKPKEVQGQYSTETNPKGSIVIDKPKEDVGYTFHAERWHYDTCAFPYEDQAVCNCPPNLRYEKNRKLKECECGYEHDKLGCCNKECFLRGPCSKGCKKMESSPAVQEISELEQYAVEKDGTDVAKSFAEVLNHIHKKVNECVRALNKLSKE